MMTRTFFVRPRSYNEFQQDQGSRGSSLEARPFRPHLYPSFPHGESNLKRILLFVLTNVMVVAVLGIVASLLGVNRFLTANGLDLTALLGFALVFGFGGAIISLLISKPMAKWTAGVRIINDPQTPDEAWIVQTVRKLADKAGIGMPEVGIFEGDPNAFATGAFKNSSLVAVSTGLLANMTQIGRAHV